MPRPRQRSDDEILEVARHALVEDPQASTVLIAERCGLSQAALFKRFGSKSALAIRALAPCGPPAWTQFVLEGPTSAPVDAQLVQIATEASSFFRRVVPRMHALRAMGIDMKELFVQGQHPPPIAAFLAMRGWFTRAVQAGLIREADPAVLATTFLGALQSDAFWRHLGGDAVDLPDLDEAALANAVVAMLFQGIQPAAPAAASEAEAS